MIEHLPKDSDLYIRFILDADFFSGKYDSCIRHLSDINDWILSLSVSRIDSDPILEIKYSESPGRFIFDENHRAVTVFLTTEEATSDLRQYFLNLWLVVGTRKFTHLSYTYRCVDSVHSTLHGS